MALVFAYSLTDAEWAFVIKGLKATNDEISINERTGNPPASTWWNMTGLLQQQINARRALLPLAEYPRLYMTFTLPQLKQYRPAFSYILNWRQPITNRTLGTAATYNEAWGKVEAHMQRASLASAQGPPHA